MPAPHVILIALENHGYNTIVGNSNFPHINAYLKTYSTCTAMFGCSHPSLPNYLAFGSGSDQHVCGDTYNPATNPLPGNTLVDSLANAGIGWRHYAEYLPSTGYLGGDSGSYPRLYTQHHNPWVYFKTVRSSSSQFNNIVTLDSGNNDTLTDYANLTADLNTGTVPPFVFVQPGNSHNGHTGTDSACDTFTFNLVSMVQSKTWYTNNAGMIILWWDEDGGTAGIGDKSTCSSNPGGGQVCCCVISAANKGATMSSNCNHWGVLRGIESLYSLPFLLNSQHTINGDLSPLLGIGTSPPPPPPAAGFAVTPGSLTYSAIVGGNNPSSQNLTLSNTGTVNGTWTSAMSGGSWLSATNASGSLNTGASVQDAMNVSISGLSSGTYNETAIFSFTPSGGSVITGNCAVQLLLGTSPPPPPPPPPPTGTYYVSAAVSSSGNGSSWALAWKRFADINWSVIVPGTVIEIDGGTSGLTYHECILIGASGTVGQPIVLRASRQANHNGLVTLWGGRGAPLPYGNQPQGAWSETADTTHLVQFQGHDYLILDGSSWHGWRLYGCSNDGLICNSASTGLTLRNLEVYDCGSATASGGQWSTDQCGFRAQGSQITVDRCDFHDCGQDCMQTGSAVSDITVTSSWLHFAREHPLNPGCAFNFNITHQDGYQVFPLTLTTTNTTFQDCIFGPGLRQGIILQQNFSTVTIRQCLFLPVVNGACIFTYYPGIVGSGMSLDRCTFYVTTYAPEQSSFSNQQTALVVNGTGFSITNCIFRRGYLQIQNPTTATCSGNIQWLTEDLAYPGSCAAVDGTTVDPNFVTDVTTFHEPPLFSELAGGDFTPQAAAAIGIGCTDFTSVSAFLAMVAGTSPPPPPPASTNNLGNGFQITAPADTTSRTLKVYSDVDRGTATMIASLSDGSAPDYYDSSLSNTAGVSAGDTTLVYQTAADGQTLTVTTVLESGLSKGMTVSSDTFNRANQTGLGTASDGETWQLINELGTPAWSITTNEGKMTGSSGVVGVALLGTKQLQDGEVVGIMQVASSGDSTGLIMRATPNAAAYYAALLTTTAVQLVYVTGGTLTLLYSQKATIKINTPYWLRFRIAKSCLWARYWPNDGSTEPTKWSIFTIDSRLPTTGQSGMRGALGPANDVLLFDTYSTADMSAISDPSSVSLYAADLSVAGTSPPPGPPPPPVGGSISALITTPIGTIDLTNEGTGDWAHWGFTSARAFDHKAPAAQQISNFTAIGSGTFTQNTGAPLAYTWSDGTPDLSAVASTTECDVTGVSNGFQMTAPADTTPRTLNVYVMLRDADGQLVLTLSDGSATAYTNTALNSTTVPIPLRYAITYNAASAGQHLTAAWTLLTDHGGTGAASTYSSDTFTRANQSGWGTASGGETYMMVNLNGTSTFSIASNTGTVTASGFAAALSILGTQTHASAEGLVRWQMSSVSDSAGMVLRATDIGQSTNTDYRANILSATVLNIDRVVGGVPTTLATAAIACSVNTLYWLRFRLDGSNLYAKCWADGTGEPAAWTVTATDTGAQAITGAGRYGLRSRIASNGDTVKYDSFTITSIASGGTPGAIGLSAATVPAVAVSPPPPPPPPPQVAGLQIVVKASDALTTPFLGVGIQQDPYTGQP